MGSVPKDSRCLAAVKWPNSWKLQFRIRVLASLLMKNGIYFTLSTNPPRKPLNPLPA
jgi:hypothetical protein